MRLLASILIALIATDAGAGECPNCGGRRVAGSGPVLFPCPICGGTGTTSAPAELVGGDPLPQPGRGSPRPVVARIEAAEGPSKVGGSGVLVSSSGSTGIVLTNWHVVRSQRDSVTVHWPDGTKSPARVLASDDAWDLAALSVARPAADPVAIAAQAPRRGDRLTIAGYGSAPHVYREESGIVTDYLSPTGRHPQQFVELKATARQGDSGGPIFDERGELAGVLFGTRDGRTVGSCSTRLRLFLAGVQNASGNAEQLASVKPAASVDCPNGRCQKR